MPEDLAMLTALEAACTQACASPSMPCAHLQSTCSQAKSSALHVVMLTPSLRLRFLRPVMSSVANKDQFGVHERFQLTTEEETETATAALAAAPQFPEAAACSHPV